MSLKKFVFPFVLVVAFCLIAGGCGGSGGGTPLSENPSGDVPAIAWVGNYHGYGNAMYGDKIISADVIIALSKPATAAESAVFSNYVVVDSRLVYSEDKVTAVVTATNSSDFTLSSDKSSLNIFLGSTNYGLSGTIGAYSFERLRLFKAASNAPTSETISASDLAGRWKVEGLIISGDPSIDFSKSFDSSILMTKNDFTMLQVLTRVSTQASEDTLTIPTMDYLDLGNISFTKIGGSYYKINVSSSDFSSDSTIVFDSADIASAYLDFRGNINIAGTYDLRKVSDPVPFSPIDMFGTWSSDSAVVYNVYEEGIGAENFTVNVVCALSMDLSRDVPVFLISADDKYSHIGQVSFDVSTDLVMMVDDTLIYFPSSTVVNSSGYSMDIKLAMTESSDKAGQFIFSSIVSEDEEKVFYVSLVGSLEKVGTSDDISPDYF